jgi:thioredoxin reductase (NADPH)
MVAARRPIAEARSDQIFPTLDERDIVRLRRYGDVRSYKKGAYLTKTGEPAPGLIVILSGRVVVSEHDALGRRQPIVTYEPGAFLAELAILSGSPALVDGIAEGTVDAIVVPPRHLREVMVDEAELGERIMRALILRRVALLESGHTGPVIVGDGSSADVLRLSNFLTRSGHPHQRLEPGTDEDAKALIERFHVHALDLPIVLCPNGRMLRNPREHELAQCLGLVRPLDFAKLYDVAIVGAGPAGLAAAVYAGSEGLSVIMLDARAFGGQAGASMRIENYLGFPTGITGMALTARAFNQAQKFGVETSIPEEAVRLHAGDKNEFVIDTQGGDRVRARAVVIASGARYRKLAIENLASFEGSHVHYWASPLEGRLCTQQDVALVGAGNSAGQAAVYLSTLASKVYLLMRGPSLERTMSRYLVDRIAAQRNIVVLPETEVVGLEGVNGSLETVRTRSAREESVLAIRHLFLFIGAEPNTEWLKICGIALDDKGFVLTRDGVGEGKRQLETNVSGVFAIGDARSGSVKRVASAVGEGAQVVTTLHSYLSSETV